MIGTTLSHFHVLRNVGVGGLGVVYEAEDVELKRRVALKVLRRDFLGKEDRRQRFVREARTSAKISHPHIATVYEVGEADGETFIAMEFVEGQNLRSLIAGKPLPIDEALRLAVQIADGLAAAHEAQVVHRDLKPENVMVAPDGRARILDFGLAKPLEPEPDTDADATVALSGEGRILGTVAYMAPEQARGLAVDGRSDHFSFGVTLYEMVTGRPAFQGETPSDTLTHILRDDPVPGIEVNREIPPELERILEKCLEKRPEDRYQDTRDLVVDLRRLVRDSESGSVSGEHRVTGSGSGSWAVRTASRRVPVAGAVAAVLLVLAAVAVGSRIFGGSVEPGGGTLDNSLAVMPFQNLRDPDDSERLGQILQELVIADLSGATGLKVFSSQRLYDVQKQIGSDERQFSRETASHIAELVGAQTLLEGTLSKLGDRWILTATVIDVDGGTVAGSCRIDGTDLYGMVDELSAHLRTEPRLAAAARAAEEDLRAKTTGSLDAYRLYLVGADLLNREDYGAAVDTLARAVEVDPSFGKAWYKLGLAQWWATQLDTFTNEEAQRPLRHLLDEHLYANRQEQLMAEAAYQLIGQNWEDARGLYEQVCELDPDDKEAWYGLGEAQFHGGKTAQTEALESFERAVSLDPSFTVAYQHIFDLNARLGRPRESLERVREFLRTDPEREIGYRWWVEAAHAIGDEDEMEASLAAARSNVGSRSDWHRMLVTAARACQERGDFVRGRHLLAEAREVSPDDVGFQWTALWAWASGELGDLDALERAFTKMEAEWADRLPMMAEGRFDLLVARGEREEARAFVNRVRQSEHAAKAAPKLVHADLLLGDDEAFRTELDRLLAAAASDEERADLLTNLGWKTLAMVGDGEGAGRWLERALELDPENGWTHVVLGWVELHAGNLDAAAARLARAEELSPSHANPRLGRGVVSLARGQPAEAERIFRELSAGRTESPVLVWLSVALAEQDRFEEAEAAARGALAMLPSYRAKTQLAWVLIAGGRDLDEGITLAEEARAMEIGAIHQRHQELPFVPSPEHCLGLAAIERGEIDEGVALLEEAAALRPDRSRIREDLRKARALL